MTRYRRQNDCGVCAESLVSFSFSFTTCSPGIDSQALTVPRRWKFPGFKPWKLQRSVTRGGRKSLTSKDYYAARRRSRATGISMARDLARGWQGDSRLGAEAGDEAGRVARGKRESPHPAARLGGVVWAEQCYVFADKLNSPCGMALVGNVFYLADSDAVRRFSGRCGK